MCATNPNLKIIQHSAPSKELDLASELFHRINRVLPPNQVIESIRPSCLVRDAVALMEEHGYSQLPVIERDEVLGVFSFRSFARGSASATLEEWTNQRTAPGDLPVDEFLETFKYARVTEEMSHFFDAMDRDNGLLIGAPDQLQGILTPMDFLRYLYRVASPFVMISEIELALRALIRQTFGPDRIETSAKRCLSKVYGGEENVPVTLEEMSFDNYKTLICHADNWALLEPIFRGTRARANGKLKEIGSIRNDLFHFKREITVKDHQILAGHRDWLLSKVKQAPAGRREESTQ